MLIINSPELSVSNFKNIANWILIHVPAVVIEIDNLAAFQHITFTAFLPLPIKRPANADKITILKSNSFCYVSINFHAPVYTTKHEYVRLDVSLFNIWFFFKDIGEEPRLK